MEVFKMRRPKKKGIIGIAVGAVTAGILGFLFLKKNKKKKNKEEI